MIEWENLPLTFNEIILIPAFCIIMPMLLWPIVSYFLYRTPTYDDEGKPRKPLKFFQIAWHRVAFFTYGYIMAPYGLYLGITQAKWPTICYTLFIFYFSGFGVNGGAHRLWAHRSYKAKWMLRFIYIVANSMAHQLSIWQWVRDHRSHHKFIDTDADPYNARRGFFFSHIGWVLSSKHPKVYERGKQIDMRDLKEDYLVQFQRRLYIPMVIFFGYYLSTAIPMYCWNESFLVGWYFSTIFRYTLVTNLTFCVNSVAHYWGMKPFEKKISAKENYILAAIVGGEGFHNYHHVFPWDYKTAELGDYGPNFAAAAIDMFAKIGWAYDMKTVPEHMIRNRAIRTGDGSHECYKFVARCEKFNSENNKVFNDKLVWGWDDPDVRDADKNDASIRNKG